MRRLGVLLALSACSHAPAAIPGDGPPPNDGPDAPHDTADGPGDDNGFVFCDAANNDLRLCLDFDGNTADHSSHGNTVGAQGVTFVQGVHGQAVNASGA